MFAVYFDCDFVYFILLNCNVERSYLEWGGKKNRSGFYIYNVSRKGKFCVCVWLWIFLCFCFFFAILKRRTKSICEAGELLLNRSVCWFFDFFYFLSFYIRLLVWRFL